MLKFLKKVPAIVSLMAAESSRPATVPPPTSFKKVGPLTATEVISKLAMSLKPRKVSSYGTKVIGSGDPVPGLFFIRSGTFVVKTGGGDQTD